jgi:hypothetical protein
MRPAAAKKFCPFDPFTHLLAQFSPPKKMIEKVSEKLICGQRNKIIYRWEKYAKF